MSDSTILVNVCREDLCERYNTSSHTNFKIFILGEEHAREIDVKYNIILKISIHLNISPPQSTVMTF